MATALDSAGNGALIRVLATGDLFVRGIYTADGAYRVFNLMRWVPGILGYDTPIEVVGSVAWGQNDRPLRGYRANRDRISSHHAVVTASLFSGGFPASPQGDRCAPAFYYLDPSHPGQYFLWCCDWNTDYNAGGLTVAYEITAVRRPM